MRVHALIVPISGSLIIPFCYPFPNTQTLLYLLVYHHQHAHIHEMRPKGNIIIDTSPALIIPFVHSPTQTYIYCTLPLFLV